MIYPPSQKAMGVSLWSFTVMVALRVNDKFHCTHTYAIAGQRLARYSFRSVRSFLWNFGKNFVKSF